MVFHKTKATFGFEALVILKDKDDKNLVLLFC